MENSPSVPSILRTLAETPRNQEIVMAFSDASSFKACSGVYAEISKARPGVRLLSLNYFLSKFLEEQAISHDCIYSEEMSDEHGALYGEAQRLAQNWFKDEARGQDFTVFEGLRLGYCLELPMFDFFQAVLKCIVDVELYLKRKSPAVILYFNPGAVADVPVEGLIDFNIFQNLLPFLCRKEGVTVHEVAVSSGGVKGQVKADCRLPGLSPPVHIGGRTFYFPWILYAILKNVFLLGKGLVSKVKRPAGRPNLWVASQSALNYLGSRFVGKALAYGKFSLLVWDGESKRVEVDNIVPHFTVDSWRQKFRRDSLKRKFHNLLQENRERLKGSTCFRGIPISEVFPQYFSALFCERFPDLVDHAVLVKKSLVKNKVSAIVSHSDYSVFERMTILLGNQLSIPTLNFQHGLEGTQLASTVLGYPGIASHHLVWGRAARDVKVSRGIDADSIHTMGCPLYAFKDYQGSGEAMSLEKPGTFLFIGSTGGQYFCDNRMTYKDNEDQLKLLLEVMKFFPAKTLVVKPRFPDPQIGIYRALIENSGAANVRIAETPIPVLLEECDIFFTTFSTSGLEGLVLNKPGIQFLFVYENKKPLIDLTGTRHVPFAEYGAALGLEQCDSQELVRQITSIYQSTEVRETLRHGRVRFLKDFAHFGEGDPVENGLRIIEKAVSGTASL